MDNGFVQVTISSPDGLVTGIRYHGIDNLLETQNKPEDRGYVSYLSTILLLINSIV